MKPDYTEAHGFFMPRVVMPGGIKYWTDLYSSATEPTDKSEPEGALMPKTERTNVEVRLRPKGDKDVVVFCKSPLLERFFKERSTGTSDKTNNKRYTGLNKYVLPAYPQSKHRHWDIDLWGEGKLYPGKGRVNISFIRAVGLSKGIEITMQCKARGRDLRRVANYLQRAMQEFCEENVKKTTRANVSW